MAENDSVFEDSTPSQDVLLEALLTSDCIAEAANKAGISERTAYRWLKQPSFQTAYQAARREIFEGTVSRIMLDIEKARQTLIDVMTDGQAAPSIRVRCAQIVLEQAVRISERHTATTRPRYDISDIPTDELAALVRALREAEKREANE